MFFFSYYYLTAKQNKKKELEERLHSLKARAKQLKNEMKEGLKRTIEIEKKYGTKKKETTE